jgi:anti-sigma factor RsiW
MLCEETRRSLSLYIDDAVSLPVRVAIDGHLDRCPVCRAEAAELRSISRSLSMLGRPSPPSDLIYTINDALMIEAAARRQSPKPSLSVRIARFLEPRLMPYTVGSFASVIMFFLMFTALRPHFIALREASHSVLVINTLDAGYDLTKPVSPESLAAERAPLGAQSPTLNPDGALAALTHAYAHSKDDDDDMIVVTDVFSNGAASLADVVQAPKDKRMLDEFESALRRDAAFVKASLDGRPDTMRVVFAVQKVDVSDRDF